MTEAAMQERHCRHADQAVELARPQPEPEVQPMSDQLVDEFDGPDRRDEDQNRADRSRQRVGTKI
jgi:hypothetical protein